MNKRNWYMHVVAKPESKAHASYVRRRTVRQVAAGVQPDAAANLTYFGGKTISRLSLINLYVGGEEPWQGPERGNIDRSLEAALSDAGLNEIIQQYFAEDAVEATMAPSRILPAEVPGIVGKDVVEGWVTDLFDGGELAGFDLGTTVVDLMLPPGVVLTDASSAEAEGEEAAPRAEIDFEEQAVDSLHGLGGYHGSVHGGPAGAEATVYYAVGVFSGPTPQGDNGIVAFDEPWKNVVATFYHELQEARTDADVEDASRNQDEALLGWYAIGHGRISGEIGDTPMEKAGQDLGLVMREIPLADGSGTVPIQLMWSNKDNGPAMPAKSVR